MSENYEKKGYLLEDFRLFHLKDNGETKQITIITNFINCCFSFPVKADILSRESAILSFRGIWS